MVYEEILLFLICQPHETLKPKPESHVATRSAMPYLKAVMRDALLQDSCILQAPQQLRLLDTSVPNSAEVFAFCWRWAVSCVCLRLWASLFRHVQSVALPAALRFLEA